MCKIRAVLAVLAGFPALWALEGRLFFTSAPNVSDQFVHIMPYRPPVIPTASRCVRNQPVDLILTLAKPAADKDGKVLIEIESVKSIEPGGKVRELVEPGKPRIALQGVKKTARDFSGIMLSGFHMTMIVEDTDPLGKTRIEVRLLDRGDGSTLELAAEIEAVENLPGAPGKPMSLRELSDFLTRYYRSPEPAKILEAFAAFLRYDEENFGNGKKAYDPLAWLCGFAELYKLNPQLRPTLAKAAAGFSVVHKRYAALILAEAGAKDDELKSADPELRRMFDEVKGKSPLSFKTVTHPAQLDALWMSFFATGKFEPIRRLVHELRKRDDVITVEEAKKLGRKPTEEERKKIVNGLVAQAAEWSLASNAKQHRLVAYYLESMLARKSYPDADVSGKLGGMLLRAGLLEVKTSPGGQKKLQVAFPERKKVAKTPNP